MELTQVNNSQQANLHQVDLTKMKSVEKLENVSDNMHSKISVAEPTLKGQSPFSLDISNNLNKISNLQSTQNSIKVQVNTLDKISQSISQVINSPKQGQVLDDIQPQVQSLMNTFNTSSKEISKVTQNGNVADSSASRTYFDGIVGARPLSGEEIYQEVSEQRERLSNLNNTINKEIEAITTDTKKSFAIEKELIKPEFQNIDFQQESAKFDSSSLKSIEGLITPTQANAQTKQNINLLAS